MPETLSRGGDSDSGSGVGLGPADEELMDRAAMQNDGPAFDSITERWTPRLMRYFFPRKTKKKHDAADMTQEALFRAWRYRASWIGWSESGRAFAPWMYTIALHVFLAWAEGLRTDPVEVAAGDAANRKEGDSAEPLESVAQSGPTVAEWAECAEFWDAILACIGGLDPEVQSILWLWIWEEATHAEIRDRLWPRKTLTAARRYVNRRGGAALGSLQRCLRRKGFEVSDLAADHLDPAAAGGNE
jgi:DNA-directed RNA polymerase specialized sigma24 family protein